MKSVRARHDRGREGIGGQVLSPQDVPGLRIERCSGIAAGGAVVGEHEQPPPIRGQGATFRTVRGARDFSGRTGSWRELPVPEPLARQAIPGPYAIFGGRTGEPAEQERRAIQVEAELIAAGQLVAKADAAVVE